VVDVTRIAPFATCDIEQERVAGVRGPRTLEVVLLTA
jgi:L-lactate utilization protein LutC